MEYPESEIVQISMDLVLYNQLFDNEVDSMEIDDIPLNHRGITAQFIQGMLRAEINEEYEIALVSLTQDAIDYLLQDVLPLNMEMWYNWGTEEGNQLIDYGRDIYTELDEYCPY